MKYLFLLCLPALLIASGCLTSSVSTGSGETYRLKRSLNTFEVDVAGKLTEIHNAVQNGLRDLEISPIAQADAFSAMTEAKFADETDFTITLQATSPKVVKMKIRVGIKGDQARSEMLFKTIERHFPRGRFSVQ
jgi:hypothetical protein